MIYWDEYDTYTIVEDVKLSNLAKEYDVKLMNGFCKETRDWFNYARIVSKRNDFNVVYTACFTYYVTMYLAEEGISAGAEEEYFLKRLDKRIHKLYLASLKKEDVQYQKVFFFNSLVDLFNSDEMMDYEKKIFQHNIRVSKEIRDWFKSFSSYRSAVLSLLVGSGEKPNLNVYDPPECSVVFMLGYSEEIIWRSLSSFGDRDRLRVLLY